MPSSDVVSWTQFDRFVRSGVPHAIDIAKDLAKSPLSVPEPPSFDSQNAELLFYNAVHLAHRREVLPRFLNILEKLRCHEHWEHLRNCRSAQITLIETLAETSLQEDREFIDLLNLWMQVQSVSALESELANARCNRNDLQASRPSARAA